MSLKTTIPVAAAAVHRDRQVQRRLGRRLVRFTQREVGSQRRQQRTGQVSVAQRLAGGFAETAVQLFKNERIGKLVEWYFAVGDMRGPCAGDEQVQRHVHLGSTQLPREFECDQATHAVAVERVRGSNSGRRAIVSSRANVFMSRKTGSSQRASRPGSCTGSSSTLLGIAPCQPRNKDAPAPA